MLFAESSTRPRSLADLLNWGLLVAPGIVLQKDGSLCCGWSYRGPDIDSATDEELLAQADSLNRALLDLGDGWVLHADAVRVPAPVYPDQGAWPDPVTRLIDQERRARWQNSPAFATRCALVLTYLPPADADQRLRRFFVTGQAVDLVSDPLQVFSDRVSALEDRIGSALRLERLDDEALLTHLHCCLTGLHHRVSVPPEPLYLDSLLASQDFYGGLAPRIGEHHIAVLSFTGLPTSTVPGLTDFLGRAGVPLRFSTRFLPLDPSTAEKALKQWRRGWLQSRRGLWFLITAAFAPSAKDRAPELSEDHHSLDMLADIDQAMAEVRRADVRYGYYTAALVLHRDSPQLLAQDIKTLSRLAHQRGLPVRNESINAVDAFLGTLPGHARQNLRRPLVSTRNLAHLLPVTSVWAGEPLNPSPLAPPGGHPALLWTSTEGSTPFHLNLHHQDVGHCLIAGPTGAGKSAFVAALISAWFRYPGARVVAFDKGFSYLPLTLAAGGAHYPVGADDSTISFCPLARIDEPSELSWALDWLDGLFHVAGLPLTPDLRQSVSAALQLVADHGSRTLTNLGFKLQEPGLRSALRPYTVEGRSIGGALLDAERDQLATSQLLTFEMSALMQLGARFTVPTLLYLFHRIEQRLDGSPTLLVLDEAWTYLADPLFTARLRAWLKELRKRNACVLFITQSLADVAQSSLREVLVESCPTKILLPSPQAANPSLAPHYEALGLNARQREIIATAAPKSEYYVVSPAGNRLIRPYLGPVALAFCGSSSPEHLRRIRHLQLTLGRSWPAQWLRELDLPSWADELLAAIR